MLEDKRPAEYNQEYMFQKLVLSCGPQPAKKYY